MWTLGFMHSPGLTAAQVQVLGYSTKVQTWLGLRFVAIPDLSTSGDQVLGEQLPPVESCDLSPPLSQPLSFLGVQWVRLLRCSVCLFWGADLWL